MTMSERLANTAVPGLEMGQPESARSRTEPEALSQQSRPLQGGRAKQGVPPEAPTRPQQPPRPAKTQTTTFLQQPAGREPDLQTRRGFLKKAAVALGLVGLGKLGFDNREALRNEFVRTQMSPEQQAALEQLKNTPPDKLAHNLIVGEDGANLRDGPKSFTSDPGVPGQANLLGRLEPGSVVSEALPVEGRDPNRPVDNNSRALWYFIPNSEQTGGAFSYSGNFQ